MPQTSLKNSIVPMAGSLTDLGFGGDALATQATEATEELKRKRQLAAQMNSMVPQQGQVAMDLGLTPGGIGQ